MTLHNLVGICYFTNYWFIHIFYTTYFILFFLDPTVYVLDFEHLRLYSFTIFLSKVSVNGYRHMDGDRVER